MRNLESNFIGMLLVAGLITILVIPSMAAEYPTKPITLIMPWPAGGSTDLVGRALVNAAKKYIGQPIIVENKPGGGGTVGTSFILTKPPDGYTIGINSCNTVIISYHMGKLDFHPINDFTYIMRLCGYLYGLVVQADSPWKTIQDFIQSARSAPQTISYGTSGIGSSGHLSMEELAYTAGVRLIHVPYKGGAECTTALLGGHVDAVSDSSGWASLVDGGKFRLLVIYSEQRSPRYPKVPTVKESGFDVVWAGPIAVFGPKGMPTPVVKKLHDAFKKAMDDPEYQAVLKRFDMPPLYMNSEDCRKDVHQNLERIGNLVQKLGLQKK